MMTTMGVLLLGWLALHFVTKRAIVLEATRSGWRMLVACGAFVLALNWAWVWHVDRAEPAASAAASETHLLADAPRGDADEADRER